MLSKITITSELSKLNKNDLVIVMVLILKIEIEWSTGDILHLRFKIYIHITAEIMS